MFVFRALPPSGLCHVILVTLSPNVRRHEHPLDVPICIFIESPTEYIDSVCLTRPYSSHFTMLFTHLQTIAYTSTHVSSTLTLYVNCITRIRGKLRLPLLFAASSSPKAISVITRQVPWAYSSSDQLSGSMSWHLAKWRPTQRQSVSSLPYHTIGTMSFWMDSRRFDNNNNCDNSNNHERISHTGKYSPGWCRYVD